jgi:RNA polymerase sigma-70 factor, ECF subfamily
VEGEDLAQLMARVAGGDRRAFRLLYQRTAAKLLATARRILKDEKAAEDAIQEAFGAKTVKGPGPDSVSTSPAAFTAATSVV